MAWERSANGRQQTAKTSCTLEYKRYKTKAGRPRKNWIDIEELVRVVPGRPTAVRSYSSCVFITDRHRMSCTIGLCSWSCFFAVRRRSTVADRRMQSVFVFITLQTTLRSTGFVHQRRPRARNYRAVFLSIALSWMRSHRLQLNNAKTEIVWLTTGRRSHVLPQQPVPVGCDLITPVLVVRDLGIHIDADVSMRFHVMGYPPLGT